MFPVAPPRRRPARFLCLPGLNCLGPPGRPMGRTSPPHHGPGSGPRQTVAGWRCGRFRCGWPPRAGSCAAGFPVPRGHAFVPASRRTAGSGRAASGGVPSPRTRDHRPGRCCAGRSRHRNRSCHRSRSRRNRSCHRNRSRRNRSRRNRSGMAPGGRRRWAARPAAGCWPGPGGKRPRAGTAGRRPPIFRSWATAIRLERDVPLLPPAAAAGPGRRRGLAAGGGGRDAYGRARPGRGLAAACRRTRLRTGPRPAGRRGAFGGTGPGRQVQRRRRAPSAVGVPAGPALRTLGRGRAALAGLRGRIVIRRRPVRTGPDPRRGVVGPAAAPPRRRPGRRPPCWPRHPR